MSKILIIILSETRGFELTFDNILKNLIEPLNGDLCLCIGVKDDYDYNNSFYKLAKYKFLYKEPEDFGDAFEYANKIISKNRIPYELMKINNKNIKINPIHWRNFLKIGEQFLGGIKDKYNQHLGSAGILIFFRYYLLKNLIDNNLLKKYDRFIITRSDYIYKLPHPNLNLLNSKFIWIPNSEHYGGYTDRHVILSNKNIIPYLNILNNLILNSNKYFFNLQKINNLNLEKLIKFNLIHNNVNHLVKELPYIMYSIRNKNGSTRWSKGIFIKKYNYYIKYISEYNKSEYYKLLYNKSDDNIDNFYKKLIHQ